MAQNTPSLKWSIDGAFQKSRGIHFQPGVNININIYIHTYTCVVCFFDVTKKSQSRSRGSVRFPKEYDHNLAAKHPKLCTYFIQNSVYL